MAAAAKMNVAERSVENILRRACVDGEEEGTLYSGETRGRRGGCRLVSSRPGYLGDTDELIGIDIQDGWSHSIHGADSN